MQQQTNPKQLRNQENSEQESHLHHSLENAREKLIAQVKKHPFWSNKAAKKMQLKDVESRQLLICELSSFCEQRELEWRYEPMRPGSATNSIPYRRVEVHNPSLPSTPQTDDTLVDSANNLSSYQNQVLDAPSTPLKSSNLNQQQKFDWHFAKDYDKLGTIQPLATVHCRQEPSADLVWSLDPLAKPNYPFEPCISYCEVPNTSFVKRCHCCDGKGRLKCSSCHGVGYEVCITCSGKGTTRSSCNQANNSSYYSKQRDCLDTDLNDASPFSSSKFNSRNDSQNQFASNSSSSSYQIDSCSYCHGSGQKRCWICAGRSFTTCTACQGVGQLRCFMRIVATWQTLKDEAIINNTDNVIPRERIRLSSGKTLVDNISDSEVSEASNISKYIFSLIINKKLTIYHLSSSILYLQNIT